MDTEQAMLDPASAFSSPDEVCHDPSLSLEDKLKILRRWEYDARELEVAEEENMAGEASINLDSVLSALNKLNASIDREHSPPTKQGGE